MLTPDILYSVALVRLCERFGCLPSQLHQEDVSFLKAIQIEARYSKVKGSSDGQ